MKFSTAGEVLEADKEYKRQVAALLDTHKERTDAEHQSDAFLSQRYISLVRGVRAATTLYLGGVNGWSLSEPIQVGPARSRQPLFVRLFLEENRQEITHTAVAAHWSEMSDMAVPRDREEVRLGVPGAVSAEFVVKNELIRPSPNAAPTQRAGFQIALHNLVLLEQTLAVVNGNHQ